MLHTWGTMIKLALALVLTACGVACAQEEAVNASAVRPFFDLARRTRVDVVGIGDSNQLQRGNGWDEGWHVALAQRLGEYATGMISLGELNGGGAGEGYRYNALSSNTSTGYRYSGAPQFAADFLNNPEAAMGPQNYLYVPAGSLGSGGGSVGVAIDADCLIGTSSRMRGHLSYGLFPGTGPGSIQPFARFEIWPFATIATGPVLTTRTGDLGLFRVAFASFDFPAGPKQSTFSFRPIPATGNVVGPAILYYARVENLERTSGASFSSMYAVGSKSSWDMATSISTASDATLTHYFESLRRLQGSQKAVLVRINTGLNDRAESRPSLLSGITPGSSASAYRDNLQAMISRITAIWSLNQWPAEELYFLLTPSHPVAQPDEPILIAYRVAASSLALATPRTACVRLDTLTNSTEMLANGWYQGGGGDRNHLSQQAYQFLAQRELLALSKPVCMADFNGDGGVDGGDIASFFQAWESGDFIADVNDDGGVDGLDAQVFVEHWIDSAC